MGLNTRFDPHPMSLETPTTLLDYLTRATEYFAGRGMENPRLNAERLLCGVLGCKRIDLYVNFERVLSSGEIEKYREYVRRRGRNEPLAYILGTAAFCGRDFSVNPSVLIPRPETELLVEHVIPLLRTTAPAFVADIGTGSGCIGITVALELPEAEIALVDVSGEALEVAKRNAHEHGVNGRAHLVQGDLGDPLRTATFHAVVANLPYVAARERDTLPPDVVEFEPHIALFGGETGLDLFEHLLADVRRVLVPGGVVALEVGQGQASVVARICQSYLPEGEISIHCDYAHIERVIVVTGINA